MTKKVGHQQQNIEFAKTKDVYSNKLNQGAHMKKINKIMIIGLLLIITLSGCRYYPRKTIRIGFFPNLTHSQAVYGYATGDFEKAFDDEYSIKWLNFNSGPSEIEAMFADEVDIGYIGPIPAINGFIKSDGDITIIAGATMNGTLLVTRKDLVIKNVKGLIGCTIAVPQFGNTQHLCLLNLLAINGLDTIEKGGNINIIQSSNPDTKTLMDKGDIDAALVPEPWATRLVNEIDANILLNSNEILDSGDYSTAVIIVNTKFYKRNKDLVEQFLRTHLNITEYINQNLEEAMVTINDKIGELTGSKLNKSVLKDLFTNIVVTYDPNVASINKFMEIYQDEKFGKYIPDKNRIYNFEILNVLLREKNMNEISVDP